MIWKPKEEIEFIDGNKNLGIKIDWSKVRKEFRKLGIPKNTYNPLKADLNKCGYVIDMSDRSRGKTTNKLILGLLLYKMYGITLQYIRQKKLDCERKNIINLYETVIEHNYIEKIFDNNFNDIEYYGKRWYLIKRDNEGNIEYKNEEHCTFCIGLDESDTLKSTYNAPKGDIIFHDEFITTIYGYNDFIRFSDICKTIIRDRISPVIFMSANTININSPWFDELCLREEIETMNRGESRYIESELGTHIYIEILGEDISKARDNVNKRFWGFKNPKLISITGKGTWATENYQHIPTYECEDDEPQILQNRVFIRMSSKLVKLKLVNDKERGLCVFVTPATKVHNDSIIMTADDINKKNEVFGVGKGTFLDAYWKLYAKNKFYYSRNSEGSFVSAYLSYFKTKIKEMNK